MKSPFKDGPGQPSTKTSNSGSAKAPGSPGPGAQGAGKIQPKQIETSIPTKGKGLSGSPFKDGVGL